MNLQSDWLTLALAVVAAIQTILLAWLASQSRTAKMKQDETNTNVALLVAALVEPTADVPAARKRKT